MASVLSAPHFHDEDAALAYVEKRLWPEGPICPHCGGVERIGKLQGQSTRKGVYKCYQCRKPFTVRVGTIFEASHIPLNIWLQGIYLMAASKKGFSANQFHRTLGVTLKTAWFMAHRIREAMKRYDLTPFGGQGNIVQADETFIGIEPGAKRKPGFQHKMKVLALIDKATGRSRSFVVNSLKASELEPILVENVNRYTRLVTDEASHYTSIARNFWSHEFVSHKALEYGRGDVTTNHVEGFFSIFKRGMKGVYQHCAKKNLQRYATEFDFRYTHRIANGFTDTERADELLRGAVGRRLTYQRSYMGA